MTEWSQNSLDRATLVWATLTGMYGNRLTRDFGDSVPDPWRNAIKSLSDPEIQRGLRRLTAAGSASTPTMPQFVKACRTIGDDEGEGRPAHTYLPPPKFDRFHEFGQRSLFRFLASTRGQVSEDQLQRLIRRKNEIVEAARVDPDMQDGDPEELGKQLEEILSSAFRKAAA